MNERDKRNLSQKQLAELAGVSNTALSQIETGQAKPRRSTLIRLAAALDEDPEEFIKLGEAWGGGVVAEHAFDEVEEEEE